MKDFCVRLGATVTYYTQLLTLDFEPDELRILQIRLNLFVACKCLHGIIFILTFHCHEKRRNLVDQVDLATYRNVID